MPANPGLRLRLITITTLLRSTSSIGIPAIGLEGSVRAAGLTTSLAPSTMVTSTCSKTGLMSSMPSSRL